MRRVLLSLLLLCALSAAAVAGAASGRSKGGEDWKVQAGTNFQRAGEYTYRYGRRNTRLQDAIRAYGRPSSCKAVGSNNHAVVSWASRGIWIDAWTYGGLPEDEDGCVSPDLIYISEIRLTDRRWTTALGLHVGDPTTKLRRLYPKAPYVSAAQAWGRNQYFLVWRHERCVIGVCSAYEQRHGIDVSRLSAQVKNGRVVAFWVPIGGQGE